MTIDTHPGQPQPPTQISDKFADLRMSGPSARERGPSGPAAADPIFRNAPEPPRTAQTLNYPVGPSAYSDGQSAYNNGRFDHMARQSAHTARRSAYLTGRSDTEFFEEDCRPNLYMSQLNFPSYLIAPQHHNIAFQTHGSEYFPAHRRPKRDNRTYEPHRANINTPQNPNQWGEDNMPISKQPHPYRTKEPVVSHRLLSI
jgi:hypothetical protein